MEVTYPVVLFEGLDGAGKTFALTNLKNYYEKQGVPVHVVDSIPFGEFLNSHDKEWFDLNLLNVRYIEYLAWQVNNYYKNIKPFVGKELVLIDRFVPSCYAYNSLDDDTFSAFLEEIMDIFLRKFFIPDITFLVDVPNDILLDRHGKTDQPIHMSKLAFIETVRANYGRFFDLYHTRGYWRNLEVVDGTRDINETVQQMAAAINESTKRLTKV